MKRIAVLVAAGTLALTSGAGLLASQAEAQSPGRHAVTARHGEPEPGDDHGHHGAGHGRHGEPEPGDDHGGHGHEPGDDHGGHGHEPGDD